MKKRLVIAGAGDFGREVVEWVKTSPVFLKNSEINEIVFIDDDNSRADASTIPLVGGISSYTPEVNDIFLCSVGNPATRERICSSLASRGATFATFVHDTALIGDRVTLGRGTIVCPAVIMSTDIVVAEQVHINVACTVGHDAQVGSYATLSSSCNLAGHVSLGSGVFLGTAVTIIPGKRVGNNSRVGAGSVVLRSLSANVSAFGNPCRPIGKIES